MVGGHKPALTPEEIEPHVLNFQIYDVNNQLKTISDDVWNQISAACGGLMSAVNIYNYVHQNRHNILTSYIKINRIEEKIYDLKKEDEDSEVIIGDTLEYEPMNISNELVADINVPSEKWASKLQEDMQSATKKNLDMESGEKLVDSLIQLKKDAYKKVGRKPAVTPEEIEPQVLNFQIYDANYQLKARKDIVWKQISAAFGGLMSAINIYHYVQQNRHNILTNYNKKNGIMERNETEENIYDLYKNDEDFEIIIDDSLEYEPVNKKTKISNEFVLDINVPHEQWANIKPVGKQWVHGRAVKRLQEGWTSVFRKLIWKSSKLPCSYSFKGHTINDFFIKAHGRCIECGSKIILKCNNYCESNKTAKFTVKTRNTKGIPHKKKVRLQKSKQYKIGKRLLIKKSVQWRRDKTRQDIQNGEKESPHLLAQLKQVKQKVTKNKLSKKVVGRKPAVRPEEIEPQVLNFQLYDDNNHLKKMNDEVWSQISAAFHGLMSAVNIYNYVQQNRHNILTNYNKINGIIEETNGIDEKNEIEEKIFDLYKDDKDFEFIIDNSLEYKPVKKKTKLNDEFILNIPSKQWADIKPVDKQWIDGRAVKRLQEGWTSVFRKLIWSNTKLPCCYSFKAHHINDFIIKAHGRCVECGSKITLMCDTYFESNKSAEFIVKTRNTKNIPHKKKIRLHKSVRHKVDKELLFSTPVRWERDNVRQDMQHSNHESPHFYKLGQLKEAKLKGTKEDSDLEPREKLVDSLIRLKSTVECNKFIKEIAIDHFHIMYWSPEQIQLHNEILKKMNGTLSMGVTDSVVRKIQTDGENSSQIYLTVICTDIDDKIIPVAQLISEKNYKPLYTYWLQRWILSGAKVPYCLITDMNEELQNAACLAFNSIDFNTYNDVCLQYLLGAELCVDLPTQMRTDTPQLLCAVTKWPCFKNVNWKIKNVFLKCIGFACTIESLKKFENFLKNLLIISLSKYLNENCLISLKYIFEAIKYFRLEEKYAINKDGNVEEGEEEMIGKNNNSTLTVKYIEKLKNEILTFMNEPKESYVGDKSNYYYKPDFASRLCNLCKEFPSWTNVMSPFFENSKTISTFSRSETYFVQLKRSHNNQFKRADEFVAQHCKEIDSDIIMAKALLDNVNGKSQSKKRVTKNTNYLLAAIDLAEQLNVINY